MRRLSASMLALLVLGVAPTVANAASASAVALGDHHTCAIVTGGLVKCWGDNGYGQLGLGDSSFHNVPGTVSLPAAATRIGAGGAFTCAAGATKAWCWGHNEQGELGTGDDMPAYVNPWATAGLTGSVSALAVGVSHACIATRSSSAGGDTIKCWGSNSSRQASSGPASKVLTPTTVTSVTTGQIRQLSAGASSSCALLTSGTVKCWGNGRTTPFTVSGLSGIKRIAQGGGHLCALLTSGTVKCTGTGIFGQLGDGKGRNSTIPVTVTGLRGIVDISAGRNHTCAVNSAGIVSCWGDNVGKQTWNGARAPRKTAVANGVKNAKATAGGLYHSCAVFKSGSIGCWGLNTAGQLGSFSQTGWLVNAAI